MKKILWFTAITYIATVVYFIVMYSLGGRINPVAQGLTGIPMAFPLISVLIVQKLIFKEKLLPCLGLSFRLNGWYLAAVVVPVLMALALNGICAVVLGENGHLVSGYLPDFMARTAIGLTIAAFSALLEEMAWRGFLYRDLRHRGFWKGALVTAVIWSVWHIPVVLVFKYPDYPAVGVLVNTVQMFMLSLSISYVREKSGSVVPAALMHGLLNTLFLTDSAVFFTGMGMFAGEGVKIAVAVLAVAALAAAGGLKRLG